MSKTNKYLYWTPRVISLLFIVFFMLFSLDVFGEYTGWELLLGFIMHNIPTFILIGLLVFSWKQEKIGGILFIILGIIMTFFFKTYLEVLSFLLISGPAYIIGILFILHSHKELAKHKKRRK